MNTKKFTVILLSVLMILQMFAVSAAAASTQEEPITGTCGESATWSVESSFPNLLRINGSGAVQGYDSAEQASEQAGYKKFQT